MSIVAGLIAALLLVGLQSKVDPGQAAFSFSIPGETRIVLSHRAGDKRFHRLLVESELRDEAHRYEATKRSIAFSVTVPGFKIDLNKDGYEEIFVINSCGKFACAVYLFEGRSLRQLGIFDALGLSIEMRTTRRGFPMICTGQTDGAARPSHTTECYEYSGRVYTLVSSNTFPAEPDQTEVSEEAPAQ